MDVRIVRCSRYLGKCLPNRGAGSNSEIVRQELGGPSFCAAAGACLLACLPAWSPNAVAGTLFKVQP